MRRETVKKKMQTKLKEIKKQLKKRMHAKVADTGRWLHRVITGYYNYYAVPGNSYALNGFRAEICRSWIKTLRRRSQKSHYYGWARYKKLIKLWIPSVRILHPYPNQRLIV